MTPKPDQIVIYHSHNNNIRLRVRLRVELFGGLWLTETMEPTRHWPTGQIINIHRSDMKPNEH